MTTYTSTKPFRFCPHCENNEMYAEEPELDDYTLTLTLTYVCDTCGLKMTEYYNFSETIIQTPNDSELCTALYNTLSKVPTAQEEADRLRQAIAQAKQEGLSK